MFETNDNKPRPQKVQAAPVRAHLDELLTAGYTPTVIARMSGVETRRVRNLLSDASEKGVPRVLTDWRISYRTADALLAIPIPDGMFVTALGPVRRLRALVRIGYSFAAIGARLGYDEALLCELALGNPEIVDSEIAYGIAALFDAWHATPGPDDTARDFGRRHRFAAPLAWGLDDDDTAGPIDDPAATPVGLMPVDDGIRRRIDPEFVEIVDEYRELGHFDEEIAASMRLPLKTFAKRLHRAGLAERRRGDGNHRNTAPIYGARFSVRLPVRMGVA